ncbi:hypothetical protein M0R45_035946 [Rubus argutus]|uniref:CCHC-type domain-containing protein n=1 Tax=Rubus argutus TaxID=59490 RepID=A0AAW1VYE2_RUBAR
MQYQLFSQKGPGRPKLSRNKEPNELPPPAGTTKLPKSYYSKNKCGKCGQKGHNRRSCGKRIQPTNASQDDITPSQPFSSSQSIGAEPRRTTLARKQVPYRQARGTNISNDAASKPIWRP